MQWPSRAKQVWICALAGLAVATGCVAECAVADERPVATVDFNRDIRPILSDTCFQCHGPDEGQRQADFRLDVKQSAFSDRGGYRAVVPGDLDKSELYRRISADDVEERMPPPDSGRTLKPVQIELFKRWIQQGADWREHWSFISPVRPRLPYVQDTSRARNPIDVFVQARLEREGIAPSPEADRETLIRRVTLDLTGLPPTPAQVADFLSDNSPDAYARLVDRLLAAPQYGERMAMNWLDAARYADTSGYQTDGDRFMWRWRDWVIEAFNRNLPFDRFTIEQMAGDLLPNPTLDQLIATGFNRNHRANSEGGIVFEEYLVEYAVDRVDTTSTVWLGLTMACGRCHNHKYDPITQKDFYSLFAFFNNLPERGRVIKFGNSAPLIKAPTRDQQSELMELSRRLAAAESELEALRPELARQQDEWESTLDTNEPIDWSISDGLILHYPFDENLMEQTSRDWPIRSQTKTGIAGHHKPAEVEGDAAGYLQGAIGAAVRLNGRQSINAGEVPFVQRDERFSCGAWIYFDAPHQGTILSRMTPDSYDYGFAVELAGDKVRVNMGPRWLDDAIRIETADSLNTGRWHHVGVTYDGSSLADGFEIYVDGRRQNVRVLLDLMTGGFNTTDPLRIGGRADGFYFQGAIDDVRCYDRQLSSEEVAVIACAEPVHAIAAISDERRTSSQARKLARYFLANVAPERFRKVDRHLQALQRHKITVQDRIPTTMVMQERADENQTFVLVRGEYDKPGEPVSAGVPACLPPLPDEAPRNRLGLARWLVDPANPLTSRVAVNRLWQLHFGRGLVVTAEDFGSQGEWPTHPDLLDWLATEYVRIGWDTKALQRLIVTSATYRQSSRLTGGFAGKPSSAFPVGLAGESAAAGGNRRAVGVTPELRKADPENLLLARAPRLRLSAETIRDQALAASGLLVTKIGGPSVKPYQPPGLWEELASQTYEQDQGEKLYRRSMYTFWKRTVPPPLMTTLDAPSRETCIVGRSRTNTPLQALALLNDVTFVEAARCLAERMMAEGGQTPDERVSYGFRLVLSREPDAQEREILTAGFERRLQRFRGATEAARKLVSIGGTQYDQSLDVSDLAAYTSVANLMLNLDEAVTRQ